jgi:tuftelin-interacting protein 11
MWANSDDEDNTPGFGGGRRKKKDYTAPIGFVSGGIKQGSKIKKEGEEEDSSVSVETCVVHVFKCERQL